MSNFDSFLFYLLTETKTASQAATIQRPVGNAIPAQKASKATDSIAQ